VTAGCIGLAAALAVMALASEPADARARPHKRFIHGASYRPPYAAIVIDDNSGRILHESEPDAPRHPASLTKVMTLYLLFGELEAGRLRLDSELPVSARAAMQNPTKLGLKAGQIIKVDDAIRGLVTKSANDAAVVIAEAIGGSEPDFAALMTRKARALGMTNTTYINASGLPAEEQITTARDQAILGRAIQHRFPTYYGYFALPSFQYRGRAMSNHNSLLRTVEGVDGIKTGYTEASGYNLISSMRRGFRRIVGVVLGERSNGARDTRMRGLIEQCIVQASDRRTAALIVEHDEPAVPEAATVTTGTDAATLPVAATDTHALPTAEPAAAVVPAAAPQVAAVPVANYSLQSAAAAPPPARSLFEDVP
jgi:D-alanyl-D-alanine carboxypeptidase